MDVSPDAARAAAWGACVKGLEIVPCELDEANAFVDRLHRHADPVPGHRFSIAVAADFYRVACCTVSAPARVVGVAIVGNPLARWLNDGFTLEVLRNCTDGTKNACSILYGAAWRSARGMGYRRLVTYTGKHESGASLRAAGFRVVAEVKPQSWHRKGRPRVDKRPKQAKLRWEAA